MSARPSLDAEIKALIAAEGPISLERYMGLALGHPSLGYYMTRDPLGAAGDFVTAPEISQMFGELLGVWSATVWQQMGAPCTLRFVELGPGRGTLMADALRAAKVLPPFRAALDLHFVEISPVLRAAQRRMIEDSGLPVTWHEGLDTVPGGPAIVLANEFFDALPVRHFMHAPRGWCERLVGLDGDRLIFGLAPECEPSLTLKAPLGSVLEVGFAARHVAAALGTRLARQGGAALIIDYGYAGPRLGETLQALRAHQFSDPLETPGEADLTTHVDFSALARSAMAGGATPHGPVRQGEFLARLGLRARADALKRGAETLQKEAIDTAVVRLGPPAETTASNPRSSATGMKGRGEGMISAGTLRGPGTSEKVGMGKLFQAMAVTGPGLPPPPGFGT